MDIDPRRYDHISIKDSEINSIVLSYLVHNCFKESAESFIGVTGTSKSPEMIGDMEKRKRITTCVLEGRLLEAIELTEEMAQDLLEKNKELHFDLLSLHFVNLIRSRNSTEALGFAQEKLSPFGKISEFLGKLEDVLALLAYDEPEKSPMFYLLSLDHRQEIAESLNRAILVHANLPSHTAMERLIQQTTVVRQFLSQEADKDAVPSFSLNEFLRS